MWPSLIKDSPDAHHLFDRFRRPRPICDSNRACCRCSPKPLINVAVPGTATRFAPSQGTGSQASAADSADPATPGVVVMLQVGAAGYPGVAVKTDIGTRWDLTAYGHIIANVTNTGTVPTSMSMRVDDAPNGDGNPWNTESAYF
ncbi:MAG TPA: hypothetical protein VGK19_11090 [Capsulimonadaceae bacterium]|jgi:hypothetical protein